MDITIRNAVPAGVSSEPLDIGVSGGKIVEIGKGLTPGDRDYDAEGRIVVPGFVETHIHLDKSCILHRCSSKRGDLEEAIGEVARLKRLHRRRRL